MRNLLPSHSCASLPALDFLFCSFYLQVRPPRRSLLMYSHDYNVTIILPLTRHSRGPGKGVSALVLPSGWISRRFHSASFVFVFIHPKWLNWSLIQQFFMFCCDLISISYQIGVKQASPCCWYIVLVCCHPSALWPRDKNSLLAQRLMTTWQHFSELTPPIVHADGWIVPADGPQQQRTTPGDTPVSSNWFVEHDSGFTVLKRPQLSDVNHTHFLWKLLFCYENIVCLWKNDLF